MKIAFDIDDCLIIPSVVTGNRDVPNFETIAILRWFQNNGHEIFLWSGSGTDWAQSWGEKLGLEPFTVISKLYPSVCTVHGTKEKGCPQCYVMDIAFDDCDVDLAKVNVKVKRIKNDISRANWNKTKRI